MQPFHVNPNQNINGAGNQNQETTTQSSVDILRLLANLNYLQSQLADIRNNNQTIQEGKQVGSTNNNLKNRETLQGYYEGKIAQVQQALSGFINYGYNSITNFFGNAFNAAGNMLNKASEWFVSQTKSIFNTNEDSGNDNSNCAFASSVMLARYFGAMNGEGSESDSQIEYMRQLSGGPINEDEGATLSTAAKGLQKLGLKANVGEANIGELVNGLNQGKKYMLAVNAERYEEFTGKDLTYSPHAVVLMGIRNGMALLFDPSNNRPIVVDLKSLQSAMSDMGNEVMEVSNPNMKNNSTFV